MHLLSNRKEEQWLHEEIQLLESRVTEISGGSDSAYEKALIRSYEAMLRDCRSRLAALTAAHGAA